MAGSNEKSKVAITEEKKEELSVQKLEGEALLKTQNALLRQDMMTVKAENLNLRKQIIEKETEILRLQSEADLKERIELFKSAGYDQAAGDVLQRLPTGDLVVKKATN